MTAIAWGLRPRQYLRKWKDDNFLQDKITFII